MREAPAPARADGTTPPASPELEFTVEAGRAVEYAVVPTLGFDLRIARPDGGAVRSVALNVQLRIAATQRSYTPGEQERLAEVFGRPEQWAQTVRSLLWTNTTAHVPPFTGSTVFELTVPCTYDFEVVAAKYLQGLDGGEVPLEFLFGGTVFYAEPDGRLQVASIAWDREASYRLPVAVWSEMMDHYFGGSAWLRLRRGTFDRLYAYRARHTLATWEDAVDSLLLKAEEG